MRLAAGKNSRPWVVPPEKPEQQLRLQNELAIPSLLAQVLVSRGFSEPVEAGRFLHASLSDLPNPFLMKDMGKAVERLFNAISRRERIMIFGDYDVDGVTSTALLFIFLRDVGGMVSYYIPNRVVEGYGLNREAICGFKDKVDLIVAVDCGTTNFEEIELAKKMGMEVIVADHHEVSAASPEAQAVLNPKQPDCSFPDKGLASVGVCFNLALALRARLRESGWLRKEKLPNLKRPLYLVALGTIGDVAPLVGSNRILVRHGLAELAETDNPGVRALKEVAGLPAGPVRAQAVAFALAPRLNAAGRLEDAAVSVELLTCTDQACARQLAQRLNSVNLARKRLVDKIAGEAKQQVKDDPSLKDRLILVVSSKDWHPGVSGIVASRLVEEFARPCLVIALRDGAGKGSARSVAGFHIQQALERCHDLLVRYGGHAAAAGFTVEEDKIAAFSQRMEEIGQQCLGRGEFNAPILADGTVTFNQLSAEEVAALQQLQPFGMGNPEPVLLSSDVSVISQTLVGSSHLKLVVKQGEDVMEAIGFNMAGLNIPSHVPLNFLHTPQVDDWRGSQEIKLKLKGVRLNPSA